ncbi:MAG: flagellar hook-length control protein FliK [Trichlorobacter sp.]
MAITNDTQQQVYDLLSRSSNLSFVSAEPATGGVQALSLSPGQRVTAEVMGQAQAGKVPVRIGVQQMNLELPIQVRQGQNLELTFVGGDPRPTFAMARPGVPAPPVSLTDASRLLSLLVSNDDVLVDPRLRSSLQSIGDLLRRSSGDTSVLANFLDDFLTYRADGRSAVVATGQLPDQPEQPVGGESGRPLAPSTGLPGRTATPFEEAASKLLLNLAQRARFTLVESANQPLRPLPLLPGDEAAALVQGNLPGGRVLVQLAGESLELQLARPVPQGELLRLALVSQQPRLVFALLGQPVTDQAARVSDAARWLSSMVTSEEGRSEMQQAVLTRLQQVVTSLPPGSPALAAIMDEAMIYGATPLLTSKALQSQSTGRAQGSVDDEVLKLLQALMQGSRMALVEPQLSAERTLPFQPGQQLKGEVLQNLGGGRFMIQVAGQNLEVLLPKGVRPGDGLNLFFVGNEPAAFLLVRHGKGGDALVSETGRWVSTLLGMQNQSAPLQEGLGILRTLLQGVPSDSVLLERQLASGLRESGLFYESHLARWFSGEYPLEGLLKEPQGRLSLNHPLPLVPREVTAEQLEAAFKLRTTPGQAPEGSADPRTMTIIREQLSTLQTGQLLFQGELFPGQSLEWRVGEREAGGQQDQPAEETPWETSVSLSLPGLGAVDAALTLSGSQVSIRLNTAQSTTAQLLDDGRSELVEQLAAAGLDTQSIEVRHGKQPPQD